MANTLISWQYTSDAGNTYVTGVNSELTTQTDGAGNPKIGGVAVPVTTVKDPLGRSFKPRRAVMSAVGKRDRYIPLFDRTCQIFVANSTPVTLDIEDSDGASSTYTRTRLVGEKWRRRKAQ